MSDYTDPEVDPLAPNDDPADAPDADDAGADLTDSEAAHADVIPDEAEVSPDDSPGERLDTGEDIGKTLPVEAEGEVLDAPAAAVLDPGPQPITPASSAEQYKDRVAYEQGVNAQLDAWWEANRAAVLDTFLAGGTVELTHDIAPSPDDPADDPADDADH